MTEQQELLFRVTIGGFCGGFTINECGITRTAPFLKRILGMTLQQALDELIQWDGVVIERVSPGKEPNIPQMPKISIAPSFDGTGIKENL